MGLACDGYIAGIVVPLRSRYYQSCGAQKLPGAARSSSETLLMVNFRLDVHHFVDFSDVV